MIKVDYSNQVQKEAILNEFKGNLFEFLVAQGLARKSNAEDQFLLSLPLDFKARLSTYEELIRTHEARLLTRLPKLSELTVQKIWDELQKHNYHFSSWNVIGKMVGTNDNDLWNETDIVGTYQNNEGDNRHISLSLKLSKEHSYVNTKSAGVKSFLTKYFTGFTETVTLMQKELNDEVDESFLRMGHKLYSMIDCEWRGQFDSQWIEHYPELPGELSLEMKNVVHENYHRVIVKLAAQLERLKIMNPEKFFDSLYALCGFGHAEIIQVNCFHHDYELTEVSIKNSNDLFSKLNRKCSLRPLKPMANSLDIVMGKITLQIRVKPMNKFTTAAYKINCSIKEK